MNQIPRIVKTLAPAILLLMIDTPVSARQHQQEPPAYRELTALFRELRNLERPERPDGVPDYTEATMRRTLDRLMVLEGRLTAIDTSGWPRSQRVEHALIKAEINAYAFQLRVLQPWVRDPAYYALLWTYQSDTPAHEGPTSHAAIDLWTYSYPLSGKDATRLAQRLRIIPPLLEQARVNLTGNARELWSAGIGSVREQIEILDDLAEKATGGSRDLAGAIRDARKATEGFAEWLTAQLPSKTGPSGIGRESYSWFLRHALLVPMTWEEEVALLKRELARAYSMLALERHRNRNHPPLRPVTTPEEFRSRTDRSIRKLMTFLNDHEILPVREYMEPALIEHRGSFQPDTLRNFFSNILHHEPNVLYSHLTHWFEIARMREEPHPSPIRREPPSFNLWMHRSEGLATGVEEMFMHAGLYDDEPRARELVWVMLAQRCARGLASLYVQANEMTMAEAKAFQFRWTPAGWADRDLGLEGSEQQLYARMPGYGTSYVTGKYLIERLITDLSRQLGSAFALKSFFRELYESGQIPVALIRWEMTGLEDELSPTGR